MENHRTYLVPANDASGYPLCQMRLVGVLPNPLLIAEVPSAAENAFFNQLTFKQQILKKLDVFYSVSGEGQ